jgi:hypothetical protein
MNHSLTETHFISQPDTIDLLCDVNLHKKNQSGINSFYS